MSHAFSKPEVMPVQEQPPGSHALQGCKGEEQTLTKVANGCRCRIRRHRAHGAIRQRLLDLGFVPNAEVEMVRCATLGDPLEMRVGDYYVTLRKREADLIDVRAA